MKDPNPISKVEPMSQSWTIPVTLGDKLNLQGSTSQAPVDPGLAIVNVSGTALQASLASVLSKLDIVLSEASKEVKNFNVAEVKVSLALDSSGSVSILGVVKASVGTRGAIEVKFTPKP